MRLDELLLKLFGLERELGKKIDNADECATEYATLCLNRAFVMGAIVGIQILLDESGDTAKEFFNKFENNGTEFSGEKIYKE